MSEDFVAGQRLGDYEILGVLGAGGMGKVYKVRNVISDRVEAMKILLPNLADQKDLADRFLREIKLLASLNHPNIAVLRTALTLDNQLVMIMEYVEGMTLASRLQQGPIPAADAVNYTDQILAALSFAHQRNVIHRDIKPANIMLTPQGVVKLMDFGIARPSNEAGLTITGTTLGSVNYMPPEQVKGEPVDARSDLYSLGVSLYEMVTGQLPFIGHSSYSLMSAHLEETPKPPITLRPDLPAGLNEIILMALAKEPGDRFQSANAFRNALRNVLPTAATPEPNPRGPDTVAEPKPVPAGILQTTPSPASATQAVASPPNQPIPAVATATLPPVATSTQLPQGGRRGLYMALGALIVVGVLFAAGLYLPRRARTQANAGSANPPPAKSAFSISNAEPAKPMADRSSGPSQPTNPPPDEPSNPAAAATSGTTDVSRSNDVSLPKLRAKIAPAEAKHRSSPAKDYPLTANTQTMSAQPSGQDTRQPSGSDQNSQVTAPADADLEEVEHQADQLNSRASALSQSIEGLRRQQSAQGYGLRGDIVASEERMKTDLSKAQSALEQQNAAKAKKFLDMAEVEVEKLEKFLGR
jgi:eukaryotic-like serine/threonine-protein kinase